MIYTVVHSNMMPNEKKDSSTWQVRCATGLVDRTSKNFRLSAIFFQTHTILGYSTLNGPGLNGPGTTVRFPCISSSRTRISLLLWTTKHYVPLILLAASSDFLEINILNLQQRQNSKTPQVCRDDSRHEPEEAQMLQTPHRILSPLGDHHPNYFMRLLK